MASRSLVLCTTGVTAALVIARNWTQIHLAAAVIRDAVMIVLIDNMPNHVRRNILSNEYSGAALEERLTQSIFRGPSTVRALWRMGSVNMNPQTHVGEKMPDIPVVVDNSEIMLSTLATGARPLLLNFGSCT